MKFLESFLSVIESYKKVFNKKDKDVQKVLADLAKFCPVDPTIKCKKPYDEKEVFMMIGRRQAFSYILGQINMSQEEINSIIKQEQIQNLKNNIVM